MDLETNAMRACCGTITAVKTKTGPRASRLGARVVPVGLAVMFASAAVFGLWLAARGIGFSAGTTARVLFVVFLAALGTVGVARARRRRSIRR